MNSPRFQQYALLLFICSIWTVSVEAKQCNALKVNAALNTDHLWSDFTYLASDELNGRKTGTEGNVKARDFIRTSFSNTGLRSFRPNYLHPFEHEKFFGNITGTNVIGWIAGTEMEERFIVLTAHYDHIGKRGRKIFNGADDNASGVAGLLEIARRLKVKPLRYSVMFVATDAEELGLYGAKAFVQNPPVDIEQIEFNVNLDMISYGGRKARLYVGGGKAFPHLQTVIDESIQQASLCLVAGHDNRGRSFDRRTMINWRKASDHYPFYKEGIPYLFFSVSDHRYYHTQDDTMDIADKQFYVAAVDTIANSLRILADMQ